MSNIYKVAESAGVSPKTAARILAGESPRSKSRDRVIEAARELGYVRNQQAANLRRGASLAIGIIVPDINNPFYGKVLQSMHDACLERGFSIILASSFGDPEEEAKALRTLQSYRVDGVMLNAAERPVGEESLDICRQFIESGKPVVLSGEIQAELPGADRIRIRNEAAVAKAVRYLASKGHERIGFIGGLRQSRAMQQRHKGYLRGLKENGLERVDGASIFPGASLPEVISSVTDLLQGFPIKGRPTAFLAGNDIIAISAMKALAQLSLAVPDEVAIIGYDGIDLAELVTPSLTTLHQPQAKIASDVADVLTGRIHGRIQSKARHLVYEPQLIIRDSA